MRKKRNESGRKKKTLVFLISYAISLHTPTYNLPRDIFVAILPIGLDFTLKIYIPVWKIETYDLCSEIYIY
jgi:hypothetical protein